VEPVLERSYLKALFVWRVRSRNEKNAIEAEVPCGFAGDVKMGVMNRIECASK
jgi:hypothetical protein